MNPEKWFYSKDGMLYCTSKQTKSGKFVVAEYKAHPFVKPKYRIKKLIDMLPEAVIQEIKDREPWKLKLIVKAKEELKAKGNNNDKQPR